MSSHLALLFAQRSSWAPDGEAPYFWMLCFLVLTVVLLVLDVATAMKGRRRTHISLALLTVPVFLTAIYFADSVGLYWNFDKPWITIHLCFAISGFIMAFVVVGTGVLHAFNRLPRAVHRRIAFFFVGLVTLATVTGILIFFHGEEKQRKAPGADHAPVRPGNDKAP